ncbi:MAG: hypothetical protein QOG58_2302 [Caballeronia sp.]|jgi:hypothetical protein|nr:hypothetical protein [Caballeronia sp.]
MTVASVRALSISSLHGATEWFDVFRGGFRLRNLKHVKPIWHPRYGDVRVAKAAPICRARLVAAEKVVRASVVDDPRTIQRAENFVSLYVGCL